MPMTNIFGGNYKAFSLYDPERMPLLGQAWRGTYYDPEIMPSSGYILIFDAAIVE